MRTIYPLATLLSLVLASWVYADEPKEPNDVWALDLNVKMLRTITVDVPQKGKKTFHYLRYEIVNKTGAAHTIVPMFELATAEKEQSHVDLVRRDVFKAIVKEEDADGKLDLRDSVTIAKNAIPASKSVQGVAIWEEVDPKATQLSVFVAGLSDGWTVDEKKQVRCKTLQLNFKSDGETIKFVGPSLWSYRIHKFAEKSDTDSAPLPQQPKTDNEWQALRQQLRDIEALRMKARHERELLASQATQLFQQVKQLESAFKNRPAGDTPELQEKQLAQIKAQLRNLQNVVDKEEDCSKECEKLSERRDLLRRALER